MKMKYLKLAMVVLLCVVAVTAAATFTWTDGQAQNNEWDVSNNWDDPTCAGSPCYPDDSNDDAIIPYDDTEWTIDLITVEIDDLTIRGSATLDKGSGGFKTLETDSVFIGSRYGAVTATVVGVKITTG